MPRPLTVNPKTGDLYAKTDMVVDRMRDGDYLGALAVAKDFKLGLTVEQRSDLKRAHEAKTNPRFYAQLGKDPNALIVRGIQTLNTVYGHRI